MVTHHFLALIDTSTTDRDSLRSDARYRGPACWGVLPDLLMGTKLSLKSSQRRRCISQAYVALACGTNHRTTLHLIDIV